MIRLLLGHASYRKDFYRVDHLDYTIQGSNRWRVISRAAILLLRSQTTVVIGIGFS